MKRTQFFVSEHKGMPTGVRIQMHIERDMLMAAHSRNYQGAYVRECVYVFEILCERRENKRIPSM